MSKETSKMKNRFPYVESFYEACIHTLHQKKTIDKDLGDLLACMKILSDMDYLHKRVFTYNTVTGSIV